VQPEYAHAYNHSATRVAERNTRLPERKLVEKALELSPGGLFHHRQHGWVLYREAI